MYILRNILKNLIGEKSLNLLEKNEAVLKVWRRTTPYNYWIENKNGDMLWHSTDKNYLEIRKFIFFHKIFKKLDDSDYKISSSSMFSDSNGLSEESVYVLDKGKFLIK